MKRITLLAAFLAAPVAASASQPAQSPERQIDALFAPWNRPGMPGAVVGVIRDGKVVLTKRYGMADIERGVPMSPSAEFLIGSMSKQFTAFAVHLLAKDGKLSLDDDVHLYLPDVPDFGRKITIRHLMHHTSGLRDYFDLMAMARPVINFLLSPEGRPFQQRLAWKIGKDLLTGRIGDWTGIYKIVRAIL